MSNHDLPLNEELFRAGYRFEFFQAVRLLERLYDRVDEVVANTARQPIGHYSDPYDEAVRIRQRQSLAFPASEIFEITSPDEGDRDRRDTLWVNVIGLCGVSGPLPRHYAQMLADPSAPRPDRESSIDDMRDSDLREYTDIFSQRLTLKQTAALREFLDIFTHRLASLFYRAWEKYRFPIAYERGRDVFSEHLYCMIGLGTGGLRGRMNIDDEILLFYTGLLAQRPRSAVALEGLLEDYFGVPVRVVQFQGQWFEMNEDLLSSLGAAGQNHQLGVSAVLWERIWDPQARFRIVVGPLSYDKFREFLPGYPAYVHLVELARFFVGEDVNFDVQPVLRRDEVPYCSLQGDPTRRLGWSMWLKEREFDRDVAQPVFAGRLARG